MIKIAFLVSGNGGTLIFVDQAIKHLNIEATVTKIIADRDCGAVSYAIKENIPQKILAKENFEENLINELDDVNPDIIITNIHKILSQKILNAFEGKFINLHYSLLPAFGGLIGMKTITEAKKQNCRFIGATVHRVNEFVDAGKILYQVSIPVNWTTSVDVEDSIFKAASMILLAYIKDLTLTSKNDTDQIIDLNNNKIYFSPSIQMESLFLDNSFWLKIKNQ